MKKSNSLPIFPWGLKNLTEKSEEINSSNPLEITEKLNQLHTNKSNDSNSQNVFDEKNNSEKLKNTQSAKNSLHTSESNPMQKSISSPTEEIDNNDKVSLPRYLYTMVENGILTNEIFKKAIEIFLASNQKRRLINILIEDCGIDREFVYRAVANHYSFESADVSSILKNKEKLQICKKLLHRLPAYYYEMAIRHKVLPYELLNNGYDKLTIVTPDTSHPVVHTIARAFNYHKYEIKYISVADWDELWRQLAFDQSLKQLGLDEDEDLTDIVQLDYESELEHSIEDEIGSGKLIELVENILEDGVRTGASDIHVIPRNNLRTEFHFRIDGKLTLWSTITDIRAEAILAVVKDRGKNLDRFEKLLSQDGFAQRNIDNQTIRFRFSTMPIYGTDLRSKLESIVIRVLRGAEVIGGIDSLGMDAHTQEIFLKAIRKTQGMVITTGPTGSGKSTTQVAALKTIMDPSLNIITIEDPVEYLLEGCRQVKLNHKLDFEGALRGLLRHDPDIIVVGEMRDRVTADIAVKLANTGHLIFSTLHTNDSSSAITRLFNMGIEPFLLAYTINLILAQRLVRKLCDRCKDIDTTIDHALLSELGFTNEEIQNTKFYRPVGCIRCVKGFRGRTGIFEALHFNKEIRQIILKSKELIDEDAIKLSAIKNGMRTLNQSAKDLVKQGITSVNEIIGIAIED